MSIDATVGSAGNTDRSPRARVRKPRKKPQSRSKPADIERWERDYQCVQLRRAEVDWPTIVEKLGYASTGHAHTRFLAFMREYPRDDVETMRDLELQRIERAAAAIEPKMRDGDVRAAEVWNKLSERRSKLMGLDKPERREITVLTDDVVQKSIRESEAAYSAKVLEARELGIELPMTMSDTGVYEVADVDSRHGVPTR